MQQQNWTHGTGAGRRSVAGRWDEVQVLALPAVRDRTQVRLLIGAVLVGLNLLDLLLTKAVLAYGGVETNPLMRQFVAGEAAPWAIKAVVPLLATTLLLCCPGHSRLSERATAAVVGIYGAVVLWNTVLLTYLWLGTF